MTFHDKKFLRTFLLIIAIVFVAIGIIKNQYMDVFRKASIICLECIGIG